MNANYTSFNSVMDTMKGKCTKLGREQAVLLRLGTYWPGQAMLRHQVQVLVTEGNHDI